MAQEGLEFSPGIHILCQLVFVIEIVARLPEIEAVVTDSGAEPSLVQELKEGGTEVILV